MHIGNLDIGGSQYIFSSYFKNSIYSIYLFIFIFIYKYLYFPVNLIREAKGFDVACALLCRRSSLLVGLLAVHWLKKFNVKRMYLYQADPRNEFKWPFNKDWPASFPSHAVLNKWGGQFFIWLYTEPAQKELSFFFKQELLLKGTSLPSGSGLLCFWSPLTDAVVEKISSCLYSLPLGGGEEQA